MHGVEENQDSGFHRNQRKQVTSEERGEQNAKGYPDVKKLRKGQRWKSVP